VGPVRPGAEVGPSVLVSAKRGGRAVTV